MTERIVTTIGGLDDVPCARTRSFTYDPDELDTMMGIGDPSDGPIFIPSTGPAMAIPEPEAGATSAGGSPGAVAAVKGAWLPDGRYVLQPGDTLFGLALTYLGSGNRWREIWAVQSDAYRSNHSPDRIFVGEVIVMTPEAQARARDLGLLGMSPQTKTKVGLAAAAVAAGLWFLHQR